MAAGRPGDAFADLVAEVTRARAHRAAGGTRGDAAAPDGAAGPHVRGSVVAIGDATGLVKPTTGGGIYYSLLSARWAAEAVGAAFERGDFSAATLGGYEEAWRAHLGRELRVGVWFWRLAARLTAADLDALARLAITDGVMPVIRETARFNWHRDLILAALRHPGVLRIVLRRLVGLASASSPRPSDG